jgi:Holliday junction DNA helicase RuvB
LGKTTVARLLARECGAGLVEVLAGTIGDPHQLVSLLCRLQRGQHLLIDEVHRLQESCQECLYPALEDGIVNVVLREGGRTRAVRVRLESFTLVGATTCLGMLSKPFRDRFPLRETLDHYGSDDLAEVVVKAAGRLGTAASPEAALEVALRSRGTPREAIRILERARDVAQVSAASDIAVVHVDQAAKRLGIDRRGLDQVERKAVRLLLRRGRAISLDSIAKQLGVDLKTFQDVHEPWLERSGLVERTPRGPDCDEEGPGALRVEAEAHAPERHPRTNGPTALRRRRPARAGARGRRLGASQELPVEVVGRIGEVDDAAVVGIRRIEAGRGRPPRKR